MKKGTMNLEDVILNLEEIKEHYKSLNKTYDKPIWKEQIKALEIAINYLNIKE